MKNGKCFTCHVAYDCPENIGELKALQEGGLFLLNFAGAKIDFAPFGMTNVMGGIICPACFDKAVLIGIEEYIELTGDLPSVRWDRYVEDMDGDLRFINGVLTKLGILSGNAAENWIVISQKQGCLNPVFYASVNLYFTSPDDAVTFAEYASVNKRDCHAMKIGPQVFTVFLPKDAPK